MHKRSPPCSIIKQRLLPNSHQCMPLLLPNIHCPHCAFTTPCNHDLQFHILFHARQHFHKCPLCPKWFHTHAGFNFHLSNTHEFNPTVIHCFRSWMMLRNNTATPYLPFHCPICPWTFHSDQTLQTHIHTHASEPECHHTCPHCSFGLILCTTLQVHLLSHSKHPCPFLCPLCPHTFSRRTNLTTHICTHNNSRPHRFPCPYCEHRMDRHNDLVLLALRSPACSDLPRLM